MNEKMLFETLKELAAEEQRKRQSEKTNQSQRQTAKLIHDFMFR